jgi:hypothetical protein
MDRRPNEGMGAEVYGYDTSRKLGFTRGQYTTIFKAEICASKAHAKVE